MGDGAAETRYDWFVGYAREPHGSGQLVFAVVVAHEEFIGTRAAAYAAPWPSRSISRGISPGWKSKRPRNPDAGRPAHPFRRRRPAPAHPHRASPFLPGGSLRGMMMIEPAVDMPNSKFSRRGGAGCPPRRAATHFAHETQDADIKDLHDMFEEALNQAQRLDKQQRIHLRKKDPQRAFALMSWELATASAIMSRWEERLSDVFSALPFGFKDAMATALTEKLRSLFWADAGRTASMGSTAKNPVPADPFPSVLRLPPGDRAAVRAYVIEEARSASAPRIHRSEEKIP
ncbi:MAG: hypothetical protein MZV70_75750 [Desulfobacterales bacterium]|nr:hypothetical protein [Desulfobacterales bacterium]